MRKPPKNNSRTHNSLRQFTVYPLWFFNHSCGRDSLPDTELSPTADETSRSIVLTIKDIRAGEEAFISYFDTEVVDYAERGKKEGIEIWELAWS